MMQTISTPWGEEPAIVEQSRDLTWYAVLRDHPPADVLVGGRGGSAEAAIAELMQQCERWAEQKPQPPG